MRTQNAIRVQRHYYRSLAGTSVVSFEVEQDIVAALIAEGFLNPNDGENRDAIAKACK
jgi:hypothetical protein